MDAEKIKKIEEQIGEKLKLLARLAKSEVEKPWEPPEGFTNERIEIEGKDRNGSQVKVIFDHLTPSKKGGLTVVYFHGGAYRIKVSNGDRALSVHISKIAGGAEVYILDYRIDKYPSALEDAIILYNHLLNNGYENNKIVFIGDSAGSNLELALSFYLRDNKIALPKNIIALSPWANPLNDLPSLKYNYEKDLILGSRANVVFEEGKIVPYFSDADLKNDAYASPIKGKFEGFPNLLVQAGGHEVLLDEAKIIAEKAKNEGVKVQFTIYDYMSHDFQIVIPEIEESQRAWLEIKKFIEEN